MVSTFLVSFYLLLVISGTHGNNACPHLFEYPTKDVNPQCYKNPDVGAWTDKIIKNHGFDVESYPVVTPDGYKVQMYRIRGEGQPIFFHTGLMCDSTSHVFIGDRALPFQFAKAGYDIWLPDYRGTDATPGHELLSFTDRKYWNYTFDDVAKYDIPTLLQKVADVSGKGGDIIYVGHSRGFFLGLMYLCNNPNETLLRGLVGLSPIGYQHPIFYLNLGFRFIAPIIAKVGPLLNVHALFTGPTDIRKLFTVVICPILPYVCYDVYILFSGMSKQFAPEDLLNFYSHFPAALSMKELDHESQLVWSEDLRKYDYGSPKKNMKAYNQTKPPKYDLGKIVNHPVYLFYADNDAVVPPSYVKRQYDDLGTQDKAMIKVPTDEASCDGPWAHIDFIAAKDMIRCLFQLLLSSFQTQLAPRNA